MCFQSTGKKQTGCVCVCLCLLVRCAMPCLLGFFFKPATKALCCVVVVFSLLLLGAGFQTLPLIFSFFSSFHTPPTHPFSLCRRANFKKVTPLPFVLSWKIETGGGGGDAFLRGSARLPLCLKRFFALPPAPFLSSDRVGVFSWLVSLLELQEKAWRTGFGTWRSSGQSSRHRERGDLERLA